MKAAGDRLCEIVLIGLWRAQDRQDWQRTGVSLGVVPMPKSLTSYCRCIERICSSWPAFLKQREKGSACKTRRISPLLMEVCNA